MSANLSFIVVSCFYYLQLNSHILLPLLFLHVHYTRSSFHIVRRNVAIAVSAASLNKLQSPNNYKEITCRFSVRRLKEKVSGHLTETELF